MEIKQNITLRLLILWKNFCSDKKFRHGVFYIHVLIVLGSSGSITGDDICQDVKVVVLSKEIQAVLHLKIFFTLDTGEKNRNQPEIFVNYYTKYYGESKHLE